MKKATHIKIPLPEKLLSVPCSEGAVIIERAENGWILRVVDVENRRTSVSVFQAADDEPVGVHLALADLLYDALSGYLQQKWQGGLVITVKEKGQEAIQENEALDDPTEK